MTWEEFTTREARRFAGRLISRTTLLRGRARDDGRLLTVNYRSDRDVERLLRSFSAATCNHGLGLDCGMRFVSTEYALICDPDAVIVGEPLVGPEAAASGPRRRLYRHQRAVLSFDLYGVSHPRCGSCNVVSLRQDWSRGFDVARALTPLFGGVMPAALLPPTRAAAGGIGSWRPDEVHCVAEISFRGGSQQHYGRLKGCSRDRPASTPKRAGSTRSRATNLCGARG
jgi:hypothetical protein